MTSSSKYIVYGLFDPRTDALRYIGKSSSGLHRPQHHLTGEALKERNYKAAWVRSLLRIDVKPEIDVLEEHASEAALNEAERFWIAYYRGIGCRLTNLTDGGDGTAGYVHTEESKRKIAAGNTGKKQSEGTKRLLSEIGKTQDHTALQRARDAYWSIPENRVKSSETRKASFTEADREEARRRGRRSHEVAHEACMAALHTEEARENHALAQKARFTVPGARIDASRSKGGTALIDNAGRRYETLTEASRITGASRANISAVLRGARQTSAGLSFSRV